MASMYVILFKTKNQPTYSLWSEYYIVCATEHTRIRSEYFVAIDYFTWFFSLVTEKIPEGFIDYNFCID